MGCILVVHGACPISASIHVDLIQWVNAKVDNGQ